MTPSRADAEYAAITIKTYCKSKEECDGCFMFKNCHSRYGDFTWPEDWMIGEKNEA